MGKRRRKRNREAAQKSRDKKKRYVQNLEERMVQLEKQNKELRDTVTKQTEQIQELLALSQQSSRHHTDISHQQIKQEPQSSYESTTNPRIKTEVIHESAALVSLQLEALVRFLLLLAILMPSFPQDPSQYTLKSQRRSQSSQKNSPTNRILLQHRHQSIGPKCSLGTFRTLKSLNLNNLLLTHSGWISNHRQTFHASSRYNAPAA